MIKHGGPVAPWRLLHALLKQQIDSGELAPGDRLPSLIAVSEKYEIAVTTVRKAINALRDDGLIVTSPMGTFVAE